MRLNLKCHGTVFPPCPIHSDDAIIAKEIREKESVALLAVLPYLYENISVALFRSSDGAAVNDKGRPLRHY